MAAEVKKKKKEAKLNSNSELAAQLDRSPLDVSVQHIFCDFDELILLIFKYEND